MKTATIISKIILLALFLMPNAILAQNQTINVNGAQIQVSSTLQTVLEQVETVYGNPLGVTMNEMYFEGPEVLPTLLGLIMHRQKIYMDQTRNIKHLDNYFNLIDQIDKFLSQLAKAHNYINPNNGSKMPPIQLQNAFTDALNGKQNANFKNNVGLDPTTVNITYLLDSSPNNNIVNNGNNNPTNRDNGHTATQPENNSNVRNVEPLFIELAEEDEAPTEINLFGEVSGAAENDIEDRNMEEELKELPPENAILGTWHGHNFGSTVNIPITFRKTGGKYIGISVKNYTGKWCKPTTITTIYTVTKTRAITDNPLLGSYREYDFQRIEKCNPPNNCSDCGEPPTTSTGRMMYNTEKNQYYFSAMGENGLPGYKRIF